MVIESPEVATEAARLMALKKLVKDAEAETEVLADTLRLFIERECPSDKTRVPGVGKLTIVRNDGRLNFSREALTAHRPIDRDKLWKWLAEVTPEQLDDLNREGAEKLLVDLELDLGAFMRKGEPYSYLLATPEK